MIRPANLPQRIKRPIITPEKSATTADLWRELHRRALAITDLAAEAAWLNQWFARVPAYGCDCKAHLIEILKSLPPDFTSPAAYFAWTVALHNAVNCSIAREEWTVERAIAFYGSFGPLP